MPRPRIPIPFVCAVLALSTSGCLPGRTVSPPPRNGAVALAERPVAVLRGTEGDTLFSRVLAADLQPLRTAERECRASQTPANEPRGAQPPPGSAAPYRSYRVDWVGVPPVVPPGSWSTGPYFYTGSVYVPLGAAIAQEYPQLVETESNSAPPGYTDSAPRRPVLVSIGTRDVRFEYRLPLARPRQLHRAPLRLRLEMELRESSGSDRCSRQVGLAVTRWVVYDGENLEQGRNVPGAPAY